MAQINIISEKPINLSELKNEIEKIKKRDGELNFRCAKTEEYLNQFVTLKNTEELKKKIEELKIPRLKETHITKIIDILPKTTEELKAVLHGYTVSISNENLKKIVDTINSFLDKASDKK